MIVPAEQIWQARYAPKTFAGAARFHYEDTSYPGPLTGATKTRTRPWVRRSRETVAFWSSPPPEKMVHRPGPAADRQPIGSRGARGVFFLWVAARLQGGAGAC